MRGSIMKMSAVRSVTAAFVVTAAVAAAHADDVTLQVNQARQRYPWN